MAIGGDALAQGKVKLTGGGGKDECSYSSMSITPDGSVSVQCSGTTTPPPASGPGAFSFTAATATGAPNSNATVTVQRVGGTDGAFDVYYWYEGAGCARSEVGAVSPKFQAGDAANKSVAVPLGASGVCAITLAAPTTPATLGTTKSVAITVTATQPPPPPASGCPATPEGMLSADLAGPGNLLFQRQSSGQVVAIKLPNIPKATGQVSFGESAGAVYTPNPVTIEVSINKCPGVIATDYANFCNLRSTNGSFNSVTWLKQAYQTIGKDNAAVYGYCWAGDPGTQYYINARWTYQSCAFAQATCGFTIQYNDGPY